MTFLKLLLIVVVVLFLLGQIRLGGRASWIDGVFGLKVIAGPLRITIFPRKKKERDDKPKKKKEPKKKADGEGEAGRTEPGKKRKLPIMDLILLAIEAAGEMKRKIRIDRLMVHLTWAAEDPAETAIGFGRMTAAVEMLRPLILNHFKVKNHDMGVAVDFQREKPQVDGELALTITIGQILSFGIRFGLKFIVLWRRSGKAAAEQQEAKL